ncbi:nucleoside recognition protein [Archaeoglobus profundus]|uniref:Nucleoside recognition domain protein n=1 Tax=Archaeoglobus profundus (strain DSM 5631 / JCM 9629 / NBRC 100127 / Av18) TaxID=572546 RepID=D2RD62_ARCPA|nr:nucleoside recognition protein [Archaeoglobus profundus]ADB58056.1 nucleoside recognition domain protein [Archaeoglobus profundus DSM 5631]
MIYQAFISTLIFLARTAPFVVISYLAIAYLSKRSYLAKALRIMAFSLKRLRLNSIAFTSFVLSFFNIVVAYTFLSQAWREKRVRDKDVIAISLLNSFPSVFSHLYSFYIPFVIPILGYLGLVYTALRFAVAMIKSFIGYLLLDKGDGLPEIERYEVRISENILKVLAVMFLTYFAIELLYSAGILNFFVKNLEFLPIDPSALTISIVAVFNLRSAIVLTAGFLEKGLSYKWALIGLLLGNVISFSVRSAKHSLPLHLSLFGKFGFKIVFINSILTLLLDVVIIAVLLMI